MVIGTKWDVCDDQSDSSEFSLEFCCHFAGERIWSWRCACIEPSDFFQDIFKDKKETFEEGEKS